MSKQTFPLRSHGNDPGEVARRGGFTLRLQPARMVTGTSIVVDGGWTMK